MIEKKKDFFFLGRRTGHSRRLHSICGFVNILLNLAEKEAHFHTQMRRRFFFRSLGCQILTLNGRMMFVSDRKKLTESFQLLRWRGDSHKNKRLLKSPFHMVDTKHLQTRTAVKNSIFFFK